MADLYTAEEIKAIFEEYNNAIKTGTPVTAELSARMKDASVGIKNYTDNLNKSLKSLGSSVLGVAKAMKDGEQGASVYNDSINAAADAIDAFAAKFGILGKIIGGLITAGARYAAEVNKQSDKLFDTYKNLSSSGLADAGGMRNIFDNMQKFGYGIEQLGDMTALLKENAKALAAFGGTAASGTKQFADAAGQIQHSEVGKSLQMLGKTPDDINKGVALFVKQQQQSGVASSAINRDLAAQSAAYIKNLDMLSKLTGDSADQLQAKLDDAMAEDAFNQTIYELKKKAAAGDAESGRLATEYENAARQLTGESLKEFQKGVGGDISAMSKTMMVSSEAVSEIGKKSFTAAGYLDKMKVGADRFREGMGGAYKLNALGDVAFSAKELSQIQSRYADETAQQQQDRAKAEQELQQKGLDPATKAQVEMRIEQMKTRDEFQSLINKGINPVTKGMAKLAGGIEDVTDKLPGSDTSTNTKIGGGESGSHWWNPSTWGKGGGGDKVTGQSGALLDLIGKGESGGNYNSLVGGKTADLTNMTIAQVQELQKTMTKANGFASSAVGKYQMISGTLAEQAKKAGLDVNTTKFDQKTQDMLAQQLVNQAGYGKKDTATVMRNLAGTWASLPQDMSGRGRYDGYNTNKAGIDPRALAAAISGPSGSYDSKMANVKPDNTLPSKDVAATDAEKRSADSDELIAKMSEHLEKQTRALQDINDNTKKSAQHAAA